MTGDLVLNADPTLALGAATKQYVDGASAGGLVLLNGQTASAVASLDFNNFLTSTYDLYKLVLVGFKMTAASAAPWLRVGTGATPTYQSGVADYGWSTYGYTLSADIDNSDSEIQLIGDSNLTNAAASSASMEINIYNPSSTSLYTGVSWTGFYHDGTNNNYLSGGGQYLATTAVTSVQVLASTSTIASGGAYLFAYVKS